VDWVFQVRRVRLTRDPRRLPVADWSSSFPLLDRESGFLSERKLKRVAVGIVEVAEVARWAAAIGRGIAKTSSLPGQFTQSIHFFASCTGDAQVSEWSQRMLNHGRLGKDQDKWPSQVAEPSDLAKRITLLGAAMHNLHPRVIRIKCDARIEVCYRQSDMRKTNVRHLHPTRKPRQPEVGSAAGSLTDSELIT